MFRKQLISSVITQEKEAIKELLAFVIQAYVEACLLLLMQLKNLVGI